MSERNTEFRDSELIKNKPLTSDLEQDNDPKLNKSKILKIIIPIIIILVIIGVAIFLIFYFIKDDNEDNNGKEDDKDIKPETVQLNATYIEYNTWDKIKIYNANYINSTYSIISNGKE